MSVTIDITDEMVREGAIALVHLQGFGWSEDPSEGGQDLYDICRLAEEEVRTVLKAALSNPGSSA